MKIKKLKELEGLKNCLYEIRWNNVNKELSVWNGQYNTPMQVIEDVEQLKLYGFEGITQLEKAKLSDIEQIADENNISPTYSRGQWFYRDGKGALRSLQGLLNEYGYYI